MLKLHIGCGEKHFGDDWVHIDARPLVKDVLVFTDEHLLDMPFASGSVEMIYSSHMLVYWDWQAGEQLLSYWRDLLCAGGVLRLSVPDFAVLCRIYQEGGMLQKIIGPLMGKMMINGEHRYMKSVYDERSLRQVLERVGFGPHSIKHWSNSDWPADVRESRRDCSVVEINGWPISLNMEAVK